MGSKVVIMNSEKHDKIFSITSHLPHLVAYNLVKSAQDFEKKQKYNLIKYSAGGLRDFSRIAASNEIMWRDIFLNNKEAVIEILDNFIDGLADLKENIKTENGNKLESLFIETRNKRNKILDSIKKLESK